LVYLGEQEDEEGKEEGKGLNRPTIKQGTKAWACNQQTCRAKEDERMHGQTAKIEVESSSVISLVADFYSIIK
jgi:hypothetical protein